MKAFWDQIHKTPTCWVWRGKQSSNGYGYVGSFQKVHRLSYELYKGPIPRGQVVKHTCDNKLCVNPDHLELGTYSENLKEAYERGLRKPKASQRDSVRLSEEQIKYVQQSQLTSGALSKKLGISTQRIRSIRRGVVKLKEIDLKSLQSDSGTLKDLAKKYGLSKHKIAELREGVHKTITPITPELLNRVTELSKTVTFNGHPNYQEISRRVGKSRQWVKRILQSEPLKV